MADDAVLEAVRAHVMPASQQGGAVRMVIIDDTSIPKKGTHSVGVARQYCAQLGRPNATSLPNATSFRHECRPKDAWAFF